MSILDQSLAAVGQAAVTGAEQKLSFDAGHPAQAKLDGAFQTLTQTLTTIKLANENAPPGPLQILTSKGGIADAGVASFDTLPAPGSNPLPANLQANTATSLTSLVTAVTSNSLPPASTSPATTAAYQYLQPLMPADAWLWASSPFFGNYSGIALLEADILLAGTGLPNPFYPGGYNAWAPTYTPAGGLGFQVANLANAAVPVESAFAAVVGAIVPPVGAVLAAGIAGEKAAFAASGAANAPASPSQLQSSWEQAQANPPASLGAAPPPPPPTTSSSAPSTSHLGLYLLGGGALVGGLALYLVSR